MEPQWAEAHGDHEPAVGEEVLGVMDHASAVVPDPSVKSGVAVVVVAAVQGGKQHESAKEP